MKKILFLSLFFFLLTTSFRGVLAVGIGDSCSPSEKGKISNCECILSSTGEKRTCCCGCDGNNWQFYHEGICEPGAGTQIVNPALKNVFGYGEGADILAQLIANALKVVFSIAGVILLAMLLFGGIQWMTAGGDKEQLAKAQGRVTSALIGFLIFMSVFAIINFLAPALGFNFLQILKIEWPTP